MKVLFNYISNHPYLPYSVRKPFFPRPVPLNPAFRASLVNDVRQLTESWQDWERDKQVLQTALAHSTDPSVKRAVDELLSHFSRERMERFFQALEGDPELWEKALSATDSSPLRTFLSEAFPEENEVAAAYRAYPVHRDPQARTNPSLEALTQFFPNLGRIFLRTFTLLNPQRPSASLYEYHCLLQAYFLFFHIPYHLIKLLSYCLEDKLKVALVAFLCISLAIGLLYSYLKWGYGSPEQISSCRRLFPTSEYASAQGRENILADLKSDLQGEGGSVLLVGDPGVGKTHLIRHLPHLFPDKRIHLFNNADLLNISAINSLNAGQKVNNAIQEGNGEVIYALDELGDTLKTQDAASIILLLKSLENHPDVHLVAGLTTEQYRLLNQADPAVLQRFSTIFLDPLQDNVDDIVWQKLRQRGVPYKREDLPHLKTLAARYFPGQSNPRAALRFVKRVGKWVQAFNPATYENEALQAKKKELARARSELIRGGHPDLTRLHQEIAELERDHQPWRATALKVQKLLHLAVKLDAGLSSRFNRLHYQIALPELHNAIERLIETLPPDIRTHIPLRLTQAVAEKWIATHPIPQAPPPAVAAAPAPAAAARAAPAAPAV